jgi:hypothetical protein
MCACHTRQEERMSIVLRKGTIAAGVALVIACWRFVAFCQHMEAKYAPAPDPWTKLATEWRAA